jgi:hypothetical protein
MIGHSHLYYEIVRIPWNIIWWYCIICWGIFIFGETCKLIGDKRFGKKLTINGAVLEVVLFIFTPIFMFITILVGIVYLLAWILTKIYDCVPIKEKK